MVLVKEETPQSKIKVKKVNRKKLTYNEKRKPLLN